MKHLFTKVLLVSTIACLGAHSALEAANLDPDMLPAGDSLGGGASQLSSSSSVVTSSGLSSSSQNPDSTPDSGTMAIGAAPLPLEGSGTRWGGWDLPSASPAPMPPIASLFSRPASPSPRTWLGGLGGSAVAAPALVSGAGAFSEVDTYYPSGAGLPGTGEAAEILDPPPVVMPVNRVAGCFSHVLGEGGGIYGGDRGPYGEGYGMPPATKLVLDPSAAPSGPPVASAAPPLGYGYPHSGGSYY